MPNVRRAGPVTTDPAPHKVINPPTDITKIKSTDARASFRSALAGAAFDRLKDALESVECRPRDHVSYVLALCPAHDDREPSLAVYRKPGRARVVCHAGCDDVAVLVPSGSGWRIFSTSRAPRTPPLDVSRAVPQVRTVRSVRRRVAPLEPAVVVGAYRYADETAGRFT